jgi:AraC-like DNA-binding protein
MRIENDVYIKIVAAKLFIDAHFNQPIDLNAVSRQALISRFHFHRLFTRIYHQTPHHYLTRKRLGHAQQLLAEDQLSIAEICTAVGFESVGSFSTLFKKETGCTPGYFRNRALLKKREAEQEPKKFVPHCFLQALE